MRRAVLMLLPLAMLACRDSKAPADAKGTPVFQATPPAPAQGAAATDDRPQGVVAGKVLERIDASPYSYLRLKTAEGEKWAAVPITDLKPGAEAKVVNAFPMPRFESKQLKRTFDMLWLGHLEGVGEASEPGHPAGAPHADLMPKSEAEAAPIKVARAAGPEARTVAEVYAQKDALSGKPVVVKAKVVKFLTGIMGKSWAHLRDGSGSDKTQDNDLAVTTQADLKVGDVVTLRGTLGRKRDFGAGYYYEVLLEDATLQK